MTAHRPLTPTGLEAMPAMTETSALAAERAATSRAADMTDARLGVRLRQLRRLRGLSQSDVAQIVGVTYQQIQKYETGKTRLPARMIPTMAKLLDVDSDLLLVGLRKDGPAPAAASAPAEHETRELLDAFTAMRHPRSRRRLLTIVKAFSAEACAVAED